jgi:hypothetical protein
MFEARTEGRVIIYARDITRGTRTRPSSGRINEEMSDCMLTYADVSKKKNMQVVKRIHVSINARDADDLDEAAVMKKIQTASGANYDAGSIRE